ncbi:MAG: tRNA pseudouridine(55) synthase TruB [Bdellovibrionales bacterium]|nr:tRNA pseudouridine(55) synthase TruB [Bdellovibrionales bacterium]
MNDGLLLVDKPGGMTSHDVVARLRKILGRKDIGHAGTLDPIATGLIVALVGKATKLSDYILNGDKAYQVGIQLGVVTDSGDISGEITHQAPVPPLSEDLLLQKIRSLTGALDLEVPIFSAVKVNGQRLYKRAHQNQPVQAPVRKMDFRKVDLLGFDGDSVRVHMDCSKGSYVRAWVKAFGEALGCGATVTELRRTRSAPYDLAGSIPLGALEGEPAEAMMGAGSAWIPLNQTLPHWPAVKIEGLDEKLIMNGQIPRKLERFLEVQFGGNGDLEGVKILSKRSGRLLSLLSHQPPLSFKIRRVFPNQ